MDSRPSITIIIATYNAGKTVRKAILSVLEQDYPALQLLVIDGASSDNTLEILSTFADSRLTVITEPDRGIYDAWNKGVKLATTDRLLFIGADDFLSSATCITEFWNRVPLDSYSATVIYGDLVSLSGDGLWRGQIGAKWSDPWTFSGRHLWSTFQIPAMATFFKKDAIVNAGLFDDSLRVVADIDLILTLAARETPLYVKSHPVTNMGYGGVSSRPNAGMVVMNEAALVRKKHGLGVYTNLEFMLRKIQHRIKYQVSITLGAKAEAKMVTSMHKLKSIMRFAR